MISLWRRVLLDSGRHHGPRQEEEEVVSTESSLGLQLPGNQPRIWRPEVITVQSWVSKDVQRDLPGLRRVSLPAGERDVNFSCLPVAFG